MTPTKRHAPARRRRSTPDEKKRKEKEKKEQELETKRIEEEKKKKEEEKKKREEERKKKKEEEKRRKEEEKVIFEEPCEPLKLPKLLPPKKPEYLQCFPSEIDISGQDVQRTVSNHLPEEFCVKDANILPPCIVSAFVKMTPLLCDIIGSVLKHIMENPQLEGIMGDFSVPVWESYPDLAF
ncbi:hypothetical protein ADUPG1_000559, partial [Aduncisulcus paluster]